MKIVYIYIRYPETILYTLLANTLIYIISAGCEVRFFNL